MTTAHARPRFSSCRGQCALASRYPEHHDRLLTVDTDPAALLDLLEIAVTWHELDYSESDLVGPADWLTFAETHTWRCPDQARRALSLAVDIVGRHSVGSAPRTPLAEVIQLLRN